MLKTYIPLVDIFKAAGQLAFFIPNIERSDIIRIENEHQREIGIL